MSGEQPISSEQVLLAGMGSNSPHKQGESEDIEEVTEGSIETFSSNNSSYWSEHTEKDVNRAKMLVKSISYNNMTNLDISNENTLMTDRPLLGKEEESKIDDSQDMIAHMHMPLKTKESSKYLSTKSVPIPYEQPLTKVEQSSREYEDSDFSGPPTPKSSKSSSEEIEIMSENTQISCQLSTPPIYYEDLEPGG